MKKLSSKMKILLVLSICAALMVPAMALADMPNPLLTGKSYEIGDYTVDLTPLKGAQSQYVTTSVVFEVVNGTSPGENMASSVKIALLDENGKVSEVAISPKQFNQKEFSNAVGMLGQNVVEGLSGLTLSIKVRGPKGAEISLDVTEQYKRSWQTQPNKTPSWPH